MVDKLNPHESVSGVHADDCKEAFKEDDVEMARAKMRKVREENSRLKMLLEKVENDYNALQMRFVSICQPQTIADQLEEDDDHHEGKGNEEPEVSLCLGRRSPVAEPKKHAKERLSPLKEGGLGLDLDFCSMDNIPSPEKSPLKDVKDDDDDPLQTGVKRARVSVRARCDTPTMTDGCQWRKYGQKISKGNPCPRAYYRCTVATSCPVRKQVQRCSQDTSILITTYEGTHNHPLPFAATAMASTTSAAASMLLSGSSSSTSHPLIGLNHVPVDSRSWPYYLPSSSPSSFPTITLDLTSDNNNNNNTSTAASSQFGNLFSITGGGFQSNPRSAMAPVWASGNFNYSSLQPAGRVISQEHIYQSPFAQMNYQAAPVPSQQALTETLTKAISSDPNFRSAIAAAITTMVGGGGGGGGGGASTTQGSNEKLEGLKKKLKLDDQAGCASSFLNQLPFSTTGSVNFSKQQPQPPFSISMGGASVTTTENVDQTKQMLLD